MRRLFLHIGAEKTGTTSIQHFLTKNYSSLLSQHGILYPTHPVLFDDVSHLLVAASFLDPSCCEFVKQHKVSIVPEIAKVMVEEYDRHHAKLMVLSAEHFSSRFQDTHIGSLSEMLKFFQVTVIVYIRRQDQMALSSFSTAVWTGRREWFDPDEVTPGCLRYDILRMLSSWAKHFGDDRLSVRIFTCNAEDDNWLIKDFMSVLGVDDLSGLHRPVKAKKNKALTGKQLKFISELNHQLPTWMECIDQQKKDAYFQANRIRVEAVNILKQIDSFNNSPGIDFILSEKYKRKILERFALDNSSVAQAFFVRNRLFPECSHEHDDTVNKKFGSETFNVSKSEYIDVIVKSLQKIDALKSELEQVELSVRTQAEQFVNSTSWRLTAPVRFVKNVLRCSWKFLERTIKEC